MTLSNSYLSLGDDFYQKIKPSPVCNPKIFLWNSRLANELNIEQQLQLKDNELADFLSGNTLIEGSDPIALVYAGHQFGGFSHQLGDGRAHLLGEITDKNGQLKDIQLKGSGPTQFSRNGDGRYALGPAIREFIMSEAMVALGVPTTTSLAVTTTGDTVYRESIEPGAIVTRIASSHLRVGTFEYFVARKNTAAIEKLTDFAIQKHYPELKDTGSERFILFLQQVVTQQIKLTVEWMRVGFIHGVMNTDNCTISGETIDYGPCAMMGVYNPSTVFSSIDRDSRYAFGNQANIVQWNMARLAETLLPLIDADADVAMQKVMVVIDGFADQFHCAYNKMLAHKLGITDYKEADKELFTELLTLMESHNMDYTISFNHLTQRINDTANNADIDALLKTWLPKWYSRLGAQDNASTVTYELMRRSNPVVIPRNHHMENTIQACLTMNNSKPAEDFIKVLASPYEPVQHTENYQDASPDSDKYHQTFCGT